jgi:hypothetical protein
MLTKSNPVRLRLLCTSQVATPSDTSNQHHEADNPQWPDAGVGNLWSPFRKPLTLIKDAWRAGQKASPNQNL